MLKKHSYSVTFAKLLSVTFLTLLFLTSCKEEAASTTGTGDSSDNSEESGDSGSGGGSGGGGSVTITVTPATQTINISKAGFSHAIGNLSSAVRLNASTRLNDGKILITGGRFNSAIVGSIYMNQTDIYTLGSSSVQDFGSSSAGANMNFQRYDHSLVTLNNNKVLVLGGSNGSGTVASAELYDPVANTYTTITEGGCTTALTGKVKAVKLSDGKVLLITQSSTSAELFDPNAGIIGCFNATGSLNTSRFDFTMTLLNNNKVLVAGGGVSSAELYDPVGATFTNTANSMTTTRTQHAATLLSDGKVLLVGGYNGAFTRLKSAELYDPNADTFTATTGSMSTERNGLSVVGFTAGGQSGNALVIGGNSNTSGTNGITTLEIYDATLGTFSDLSVQLNATGTNNHSTVMAADGKRVVVSGGWSTGNNANYLFNTDLGYATTLSASGGTAPYTYSTSPNYGTISSSTYSVPVGSTSTTLTATDANSDTGAATLTFDSTNY